MIVCRNTQEDNTAKALGSLPPVETGKENVKVIISSKAAFRVRTRTTLL